MLPLLKKPNTQKKTPAFITYGKGNDSIVDERWRYIQYEDGSEELYDHNVDPHEWFNKATSVEHQSTIAAFRLQLSQSKMQV